MTTEILAVLAAFSSEFSRPTWKNIQTLLIGTILCRGPRRISNVLRVMGLASIRNFSKYHRVLSRAEWDSLALAKILLGLLIKLLPESWPILVAVDETLERRRGKKIKAKGLYRDAVQSTQSNVVTSYGLKWEAMMLIVPLPWCKRTWALPFLTVLAPSKRSNEAAGRRHKTSLDWTRQMVCLVSHWLKRQWILVGDGAYACMDLALTCIKLNVCLWYHAGCAPVTLRIVLVKTPGGKNEAETLFSTNTTLTPTQIIHYFVLRWNIEVTFEETRAHLGIETQRQWSDKAIARTTPLLMGLFSFITLTAFSMHQTKALVSMETASWYDKKGELTFSDIIAIVRQSIWANKYCSKCENQLDLHQCSKESINSLIYQLTLAA